MVDAFIAYVQAFNSLANWLFLFIHYKSGPYFFCFTDL